ncbi:MAG: tetratricopeptide repeat protein [Polyangiaceae bacterium]
MPTEPSKTTRSFALRARQLGVAILLAAALVPRPAHADDKNEASKHFTRGLELYRGKNYDGALAEFRRAYELAPNYRILFNIGQLQYDQRQWSASLATLQKYLAEGGTDVPAERRTLATTNIDHCNELVAHIQVISQVPGAVSLDDAPVGASPIDKDLVVDPGRYRITLAPTDQSALITRTLEVASGDRPKVELVATPPLVAIVPPPLPPSTAPLKSHDYPPPAPQTHPSRTPAWISLGATTALVGGTVTMALIANNAQSALDRDLNRFPTNDGDVRGRRKDVKTSAAVTDILGATAIVGGLVTTYFFITTSSSSRRVAISIGPGSVGVSGPFE